MGILQTFKIFSGNAMQSEARLHPIFPAIRQTRLNTPNPNREGERAKQKHKYIFIYLKKESKDASCLKIPQ